jgi:hypothetical protein
MFKILFLLTSIFISFSMEDEVDDLNSKLSNLQNRIEENYNFPLLEEVKKDIDERLNLLLRWSLQNISKKAQHIILGCEQWEMEAKFGDQEHNWIPISSAYLTSRKNFIDHKTGKEIDLEKFLEISKGGIIADFNNKEHLELIQKKLCEGSIESIWMDNWVFYFTDWNLETMEVFKKMLKKGGTINYPLQFHSISSFVYSFDWTSVGVERQEISEKNTQAFNKFMTDYLNNQGETINVFYKLNNYLIFMKASNKKETFHDNIIDLITENILKNHQTKHPNKLFMGECLLISKHRKDVIAEQHRKLWDNIFGKNSTSYEQQAELPFKYFTSYQKDSDKGENTISDFITVTKNND